MADTREEALALADQYHEFHAVTRVFELAWAHSQVELQHFICRLPRKHLFQRLAATFFSPVHGCGPLPRSAIRQSAGAARAVAAWHLRR